MDWSKLDATINLEEFKTEIASESEYEEVPKGMYEVSINKMEIKASKKGAPMLSVWFKVLAGKYAKQMIFYNQVLTHPFQLKIALAFLESLIDGGNFEFNGYNQLSNDVEGLFEHITSNNLEYVLNYTQNKKGYDIFIIEDVLYP